MLKMDFLKYLILNNYCIRSKQQEWPFLSDLSTFRPPVIKAEKLSQPKVHREYAGPWSLKLPKDPCIKRLDPSGGDFFSEDTYR